MHMVQETGVLIFGVQMFELRKLTQVTLGTHMHLFQKQLC